MYIYDNWWTLSPVDVNSESSFVVYPAGHPDFELVINYRYAVRPAVYLTSEVQITGGNGSQSNPYVIE